MNRNKLHFSGILFGAFICLVMILSAGLALGGVDTEGIYTVTTSDGVNLKMLRYRPSTEADFRTSGQPVVLFNGILTNMNEFLSHTPEDREDNYADMTLPTPLAEWAEDDPYIQEDPMRYYSLAHYLWVKGYDTWLTNYRGTGRGELESDEGSNLTTLDVWGILDTVPCIEKVREVTGQDPFIGGHSTGGFSSYAYLQGAYFDLDELQDGYENGYIPHVKCDTDLAVERNAHIKGYIAIDPGLTPWVMDWADFKLMWRIVGLPVYLDLDTLMIKVVNPILPDAVLSTALEVVLNTINTLDRDYGYRPYISLLIPYLDFWNISNTDPHVADFFARSCATSVYMRGISQWVDIGLRDRIREHWKNGKENMDVLEGPEPTTNDGYYYYDEHMQNVTVPTIAVLSYTDGLVRAEDVISMLMEAKTWNESDEYHLIPNTGHADIPIGLNAPYITFPYIGAWLDKLCANDSVPTDVKEASSVDIQDQSHALDAGTDTSEGGCFIMITAPIY